MAIEIPTDGALRKAFAQYRADTSQRLRLDIRRNRAAFIRDLMARADLDVETFNREVWTFEWDTRVAGRSVKGLIPSTKPIEADALAELQRAIQGGQLELHGNYTWGSGSKVFGPAVADKSVLAPGLRVAREVLLSDAAPIEKARRLMSGEIKGFGENIATGLVMMFHPQDLAIYNQASQSATRLLGFGTKTLDDFQSVVGELRAALPCEDFLELDWFLFLILEGAYPDVFPFAAKIRHWQGRHCEQARIEYRQRKEREALALVQGKGRALTKTELSRFLDVLNADFYGGEEHGSRFGQALVGNNRNGMLEHAEKISEWVQRFLTVGAADVASLMSEFLKESPAGAGRVLGSLLLYLRDPEKYSIWVPAMVEGLKDLTYTELSGKSGNAYLQYNDEVQRLRRVMGLAPQEPDILLCIRGEPHSGAGFFSDRTFALMKQLHEEQTAKFYSDHGDEFLRHIEEPLHRLLAAVAGALPATVTSGMETEKRLFSRIPKNDYGRGGAWDFYWGAFYPKGGKRTADPQLYVFISATGLRFGFYVGDYGEGPRKRMAKTCAEHAGVLKRLLEPGLAGDDLVFGELDEAEGLLLLPRESKRLAWANWLGEPERYGFRAMTEIPPHEVITLSEPALVERIAKVFERVFPLVLLAQHDAPLDAVRQYLGAELPVEEEENPVYPLDAFAAETYLPREEIARWVRAVEHKKQVVFYGPPGTGKTFVAQRLARHLIGGGDGFTETLQFHPSYAYEDFMQGLRPMALKGGGLEYAMVPGRFKDFCARARERRGRCVLVLDEMNRANLARVFGELMYLLEYRKEAAPLAGGERFQIPENVAVIGTMNTADRSIALVDHALRRRFAFLALYPNYDILRKYHAGQEFRPDGLISVLDRLNAAINDRHFSVGVSFFLDRQIKAKMQDVWQTEIEPYIEELFFDQPGTAPSFAWEKVRSSIIGA